MNVRQHLQVLQFKGVFSDLWTFIIPKSLFLIMNAWMLMSSNLFDTQTERMLYE